MRRQGVLLPIAVHAAVVAACVCGVGGRPQSPKSSKLASLGPGFSWNCKTAGHAGSCGKLNRSTATFELIDEMDIGMVTDFLQEDTARQLVEKMKAIPDSEWTQIDNKKARSFGNSKRAYKAKVDMDYQMYDLQLSHHKELRDMVEPLVAPLFQGEKQKLSLFFGKYQHGSYVTSHTDGATITLNGDDRWDRKRAFLLYLNDGWTDDDGGFFTDEEDEGHPHYTPGWNTLLTFRVPRWHLVTPVKAHRTRWSFYGWTLAAKPTDWERLVMFVTASPLKAFGYLIGILIGFSVAIGCLKLLANDVKHPSKRD